MCKIIQEVISLFVQFSDTGPMFYENCLAVKGLKRIRQMYRTSGC